MKRGPKKKAHPLANVGTSMVLYALHRGIKTPRDIAEKLEMKPPNVMQQIRRLERIGVVERGKKEKKSQKYEIVWGKLQKIYLDHALEPREFIVDKERGKLIPTAKEVRRTARIKKRLVKNRYFQELLMDFLAIPATDCIMYAGFERSHVPPAVLDTIRDFDFGIAWLYPYIDWVKKDLRDSEKREFMKGLEEWYEWTGDLSIAPIDTLIKIFESMDLPAKFTRKLAKK